MRSGRVASALCLLLAASGCGDSSESARSRASGGSGGTSGSVGTGGAAGSDAGLDPMSELADCAGQVSTLLIATKSSMPTAGSEGYLLPSPANLEALGESISALVAGDGGTARARAASAGYDLCRVAAVALWRPLAPTSGGASLALRSKGARPVILEAPHPLYDTQTLEQSVGLFDSLGARAIIASGTHRCANSAASTRSGTTDACSPGTQQPFRESDMAHVVGSFFDRAHVTLASLFADDLVIAVHGMADSGVSISDGTESAISANSPVALLAFALAKSFAGSAVAGEPITTCNDYPGALAVLSRNCGTTDVQGRLLNGSATPCTQAPTTSSGRYLHMEQSPTVRAEPVLVLDALTQIVPAGSSP